jgi:phosphoglycolate phosphatase
VQQRERDLTHFGREPLEDATIAAMIGDGVHDAGAQGIRQGECGRGGRGSAGPRPRLFLDYYREHKLDFTYAYEGVLEALAALRALRDQPKAARAWRWPC